MEAADNENKARQSGHHAAEWSWIIYPLLLAVPVIIFKLFLISSFHQLPGPVYGGDAYWHYAQSLHISLGEAPWSNPQVAGEYEYYGWLTPLFISMFSKIIPDFFSAYIYFTIIQALFGLIAFYYLGHVLFRNKYAALLAAFLGSANVVLYQPSIGGTGGFILMPLFLAFMYKSLADGDLRNRILAGLFFGLASLTHVTYFPAGMILIIITFAYLAFFRTWGFSMKNSRFSFSAGKTHVKSAISRLWLLALVGIVISMAFWGPVIFAYKGEIKNPVNEYTNPDLSKFGLVIAYEQLSGFLFSFESLFSLNIYGFLYSLLVLLALYSAFKSQDSKSKFCIAMFISAIIGGFHYFITIPLFGVSAIPSRLFDAFISPLSVVLFVSGIILVWNFVKDSRLQKIIAAVVFIAIIFNTSASVGNLGNDQWFKVGRDQNFAFSEVTQWINQNTGINDVFLSQQELSFAINGLTARKIMVSRRTHFSPYIDIDQRLADAAVILYGNNENKTIELLTEYGVKYLYWDANWLNFAAQSEPILIFPEFDSYLEQNNVSFMRVNTFLDPAYSPRYPRYNLLAIGPARNDIARPWSAQLDSHLELLKEFRLQGQTFAMIYRVKY